MSATARQRLARELCHRLLARLEAGRIEVREGTRVIAFGPVDASLRAAVEIHDPEAWCELLRGGLGLGESYADELWATDDLVTLIRIAARAMPAVDRIRRLVHPAVGPAQRLASRVPRNTRRGARSNISSHYDLGNELFSRFLDERLQYSCGYFENADATLEEAQLAKLERICQALRLRPDDHLLEIGTGWGGLAIHAAAEYGCRVTTTTISREQREHAVRWVAEQGLSDRVEVLFEDYRDLKGSFDKLVSVEMVEAVGWQYFGAFFAKCSSLLRDEGLMLLQSILIDDRAYELEKASRTFANTQVFPGGCLPSMKVIVEAVATRTDMSTAWAEDITPHYAETLRVWRERFEAAWPALRSAGYDQRFRRVWRFYLAFSEAGFRERRIRDVQMLFAKPAFRGDDLVPLVARDSELGPLADAEPQPG